MKTLKHLSLVALALLVSACAERIKVTSPESAIVASVAGIGEVRSQVVDACDGVFDGLDTAGDDDPSTIDECAAIGYIDTQTKEELIASLESALEAVEKANGARVAGRLVEEQGLVAQTEAILQYVLSILEAAQ